MTNDGHTVWTDFRLNRLAADVEANTATCTELRLTAEALLQVVTIHQNNFETVSRDVLGLQVEIRRLVEELRGRNQ